MDFSLAVCEWTELLGTDRVSCDAGIKDHYARSSQEFSTRPAAVLYPTTTEEVQQIVRIAQKYRTPLYPISRGNNWGYGDACATTDHQVIVDLRRMNKILHVDEKLAYAVVEPGVTQQQLHEYLVEHKLNLWLDVTGAGPDASLVGNTIERGFGHTPAGDHFHMSAGYEVVLPDGRVVRTGFGHYKNAQAADVFKPGIGPSLDGLFTQSNFGIVTRMSIWLLPKPQCLRAFAFSCRNHEDLPKVVDAIRSLRLHGLLQSTIHIANDLRVLSARTRYPWEAMDGLTPLSNDVRAKLRKQYGIGAWNGIGGIYGTNDSVEATCRAVQAALGRFATVRFFDESTLKLAEKGARILKFLGIGKGLCQQLEAVKPVFALLKGIPAADHLAGVSWRSKFAGKSTNPLDNRAGCMWLSPVVPAVGTAAQDIMNIVAPVFDEFGFEPLATLTSITPRALCCVLTISYDKENKAEALRATQCYKKLLTVCTDAGYIPYRTGIQSMPRLAQNSEVFWELNAQLKASLDPANILAPGRYQPVAVEPKIAAADTSAVWTAVEKTSESGRTIKLRDSVFRM
jgi:4-cresol dehydrogenase (hydroxylating) flavoprotein subunit